MSSQLSKTFSFHLNALTDSPLYGKRVNPAHFLITADQGSFRSFHKDNFTGNPSVSHIFYGLFQAAQISVIAYIGTDSYMPNPVSAAFSTNRSKFGNQCRRNIVDTKIPHIFQNLQCMALSRTGHTCKND